MLSLQCALVKEYVLNSDLIWYVKAYYSQFNFVFMTVPGKPKKTLVLLSSVRHPDEGGGGVVGTDLANGFNDIVDDDAECDTDPSDSEKARTHGKSSL